jgi:hypothetical protein
MLPISRSRTNAPLAQIFSDDVNRIGDDVIGWRVRIKDHFDSFEERVWHSAFVGSGSIALKDQTVLALTTGASNGNRTEIISRFGVGKLTDLVHGFSVRILVADTTLRTDVVGLYKADGTPLLAFLRAEAGGGATWTLQVRRDGSTLEQVDTAQTPTANTWYTLAAHVVDATHVAWSVHTAEDGAALASGTLTLAGSISSTDALTFRARVDTVTNAAKSSQIDYVSVVAGRATGAVSGDPTRTQRSTMHYGTFGFLDGWGYGSGGAGTAGYLRQTLDSAAYSKPALLVIAPPPNAVALRRVRVWVKGGGGHAALPNNMPRALLISHVPSTETFSTIATVTDASGTVGAYQAIHQLPDASVNVTLAPDTTLYTVRVDGESDGINFQVGLEIRGIECLWDFSR